MRNFLLRISESSRSKDWRHSMLPFIMACVYLWILYFNLAFDTGTLLLVTLSLITSAGFAALGYFINEFFDQRHDALAGKINRATSLTLVQKLGLFFLISAIAFFPWLWLPTNGWSWALVSIQVGLFLLYSIPCTRLKSVPFVSNLVDMGYAYWIPMLLSFHTFALFAKGHYPCWLSPFAVTVALIGFRNIVIHQVNDVFHDRIAGITTLPRLLGPKRLTLFLYTLLTVEFTSFVTFSVMISAEGRYHYLLITISFIHFTIIRLSSLKNKGGLNFSPLHRLRHLTDPFYQIYFPLLLLIILSSEDLMWTSLLPLHTALFVPRYLLNDAWVGMKDIPPKVGASYWRVYVWTRHIMSCAVNYPIYWLFRLLGIDLVNERKSAMQYLISRLR